MTPIPPLAEEPCAGHIARFKTYNQDLGSYRDLVRAVGLLKAPARAPSCTLDAIADLCDIDRDSYLSLHSMLPFTCFVNCDSEESEGQIKAQWSIQQRKTMGLRSPRPYAYFCDFCVSEDLGFWHVSYWRRVHQLPGVHVCDRHHRLLHRVAAADAFSRLPHQWSGSFYAHVAPYAEQVSLHPRVRRFVDLCETMLLAGRPFGHGPVKAALRAEALRAGFGTNNAARKGSNFLSDLAMDTLPRVFLCEVFGPLGTKRANTFFQPIDGALSTHFGTPPALALAMTLLFETNDLAIAALQENGSYNETPWRSRAVAGLVL